MFWPEIICLWHCMPWDWALIVLLMETAESGRLFCIIIRLANWHAVTDVDQGDRCFIPSPPCRPFSRSILFFAATFSSARFIIFMLSLHFCCKRPHGFHGHTRRKWIFHLYSSADTRSDYASHMDQLFYDLITSLWFVSELDFPWGLYSTRFIHGKCCLTKNSRVL